VASDEGIERELAPGDLIVRGPGDRVAISFDRRISLFHCHFSFSGPVRADLAELDNENRLDLLHSLWHPQGHVFLLPDILSVAGRAQASELFTEMIPLVRSHAPGDRLAFQARFLLLLQQVTQETMDHLHQAAHGIAGAGPLRHARAALHQINPRLGQRISLREIAECLRLNPDYLSRVFKQHVGRSVGRYILDRRLDVARDLLLSAPLSIKEIARQVGFDDALYFSRIFRRETGLSPRDYRQGRGR
jgi:AraC-like DNA-binding protein